MPFWLGRREIMREKFNYNHNVKSHWRFAALAAAALVLSACGSGSEGDGGGDPAQSADSEAASSGDTAISIATGGTGGVYYPFGGGVATMIRKDVDGYGATVQETNASVDNMLLLKKG